MKRITKMLLILGNTLLACNSSNDNIGNEYYKSPHFMLHFAKEAFVTVPYGNQYAIAYESKGEIENVGSLVWRSALLKLRIVYILDNDNEITNEQLDPAPLLMPSYEKLLPGQLIASSKKSFSLLSPRVTRDYLSYPIKRVLIVYELSGEDALNNGNRTQGVILQKEVTEEWIAYVKKWNENSNSSKSAEASFFSDTTEQCGL